MIPSRLFKSKTLFSLRLNNNNIIEKIKNDFIIHGLLFVTRQWFGVNYETLTFEKYLQTTAFRRRVLFILSDNIINRLSLIVERIICNISLR